MPFYWLILGLLGVWRITHLFYGEDGPWDIFVRLRRVAGNSAWGSLLDCFYCLSIWVALPFAWLLGQDWKHRLLLWPALSGGAILLERLIPKNEPRASISYLQKTKRRAIVCCGQNRTQLGRRNQHYNALAAGRSFRSSSNPGRSAIHLHRAHCHDGDWASLWPSLPF